jgi:hypothetical protein
MAALLLSVIVPGLGQIFNREIKKGFIILASCLGLGLLTYWFSGLNKVSIGLALILLWGSAIVDAYKVAKASDQPSDFYYRKSYVVAMLLLVGPLALPLLWQSPHFSRFARWTWTVIVAAAIVMFVATPYLLSWLVKQATGMTGKSEAIFSPFSARPSQRFPLELTSWAMSRNYSRRLRDACKPRVRKVGASKSGPGVFRSHAGKRLLRNGHRSHWTKA